MYAGHFAAGLALKAAEPDAPTWGLLVGAAFFDLLFGPFVLFGLESAHLTPGVSPGFSLDHIDWSHSLLTALLWSAAFGALFHRRGRRVATMLAVAAFSHFVLDLVVHPPDLALWPGAQVHLGLGLWRRWPTGWWGVELLVVVSLLAVYVVRGERDRRFAARPTSVAGVVLALHVLNSPWLSFIG